MTILRNCSKRARQEARAALGRLSAVERLICIFLQAGFAGVEIATHLRAPVAEMDDMLTRIDRVLAEARVQRLQ